MNDYVVSIAARIPESVKNKWSDTGICRTFSMLFLFSSRWVPRKLHRGKWCTGKKFCQYAPRPWMWVIECSRFLPLRFMGASVTHDVMLALVHRGALRKLVSKSRTVQTTVQTTTVSTMQTPATGSVTPWTPYSSKKSPELSGQALCLVCCTIALGVQQTNCEWMPSVATKITTVFRHLQGGFTTSDW